jgi:peptidoglycan/LPS O-acetylase OafA/YrhL
MLKQRITFIDGLRGVAAILVLFGHVLEQFIKLHPTAWIDQILDVTGFGRVGVVAFFCISGFVIPFSFQPQHPVPNFLISRFFRLYPAYWLSLVLAALLIGEMGTRMLLANATMAPILLGEPDAISVYWTLFIELLFYGLCLAMFMLGLLQRTWALALVAVGLWAAAAFAAVLAWIDAPIQPPTGIPAYLGIMLLGSVWRRAWLDRDPFARRLMPWLVATVVATVAVVGLLGYDESNYPDRPLADFLGVFVGLALFFAAFAFRDRLQRRGAVWLGGISYSLYLLHPLAVLVCSWLAQSAGSVWLAALYLALSVPLSLLVADVAYRLVERPAVRLGKLLSRQTLGQNPASA